MSEEANWMPEFNKALGNVKMSDAFELPLQLAVNELAIIDKNDCVIGWADAFAGEVARDSIVNAVNNHDRLTEENQKLREAVKLVHIANNMSNVTGWNELVKLLEQTK